MRRLLVVLLLALALPLSAATQPNPSLRQRELIDELLRVLDIQKMEQQIFDTIFAQITDQLVQQAGQDQDLVEQAKVDGLRFRELFAKANVHEVTRDIYVNVYGKYFNEEDLTALIAFYQSPVGKKALSVMPQTMQEAMEQANTVLPPKIESILEQVREERDKRMPWKKTISLMRDLGSAVEEYYAENDRYPATVDDAGVELESDVWGHTLAYVVSSDGQHYRVVSSGADGIFDWDSRRIVEMAEGAEIRYRDRLEDDLIYADGEFVQLPKVAAPKE